MTIHTLFEHVSDGILILSDRGELIRANARAQDLCSRLTQIATDPDPLSKTIWQLCQPLMRFDQCTLTPEPLTVAEGEFAIGAGSIRVRVQRVELEDMAYPCVMVILEDQTEQARHSAYADAQQWGLSRRETEVWHLRRMGKTYQAIASELYITLETVKKHLKSIRIKRDLAGFDD